LIVEAGLRAGGISPKLHFHVPSGAKSAYLQQHHMGKAFLRFSLVTACALLAGCDASWNRSNEPGLRDDLSELFTRSHLSVASFSCGMIGTTREAYATLTLSKADADKLIQELGLAEYKNPIVSGRRLPPQLTDAAGKNALAAAWEKSPDIRLLAIEERPPALRLKSGRNFDHLFLFIRESTGEACLFVSYSYG
jgi:hypothetical protein